VQKWRPTSLLRTPGEWCQGSSKPSSMFRCPRPVPSQLLAHRRIGRCHAHEQRGHPLRYPFLTPLPKRECLWCAVAGGEEGLSVGPLPLSVPCDCVGSSQSHICMRPGRSQIRCRGGQPLELRRNWTQQMTGHGVARLVVAVGPGRTKSNYLQTANLPTRGRRATQ
jgi:hypothetical protein